MYRNEIQPEINAKYNHANVQVFQLIEDLHTAGNVSSPRGLKCKEANIATLDIDPLYPIMDYPDRRFNWKYLAGELAWYIKGERDISFINNFSSFWKGICPDGQANSNYGNLLFGIHPDTLIDDSEYGGGVNQLEWVYRTLANDKNSRQAVAFFNSPTFQIEGNKDFVCTMYVNFWIRKDTLDMKVQMRSNDVFYGLSYDAPWFSVLHQSMYLNLKQLYPDLKLGMYYHCADNIHFYERHFELAESILDKGIDSSSYKMELKEALFSFEEGKFQLSESAEDYLAKIEELIDKPEFRTMKQENFREILTDIFNISQ